ncbi:MAG: hypothetical protein ACI32N_03745 [Bulleidia sp.]
MFFEFLKLMRNRWMVICICIMTAVTTGMFLSDLKVSEDGSNMDAIREYYQNPEQFLLTYENQDVLDETQSETLSRMLQQRDYQDNVEHLIQENRLRLVMGIATEEYEIRSMEKADQRYAKMSDISVPLSYHGGIETFLSGTYSVLAGILTGILSCVILLVYDRRQPVFSVVQASVNGGRKLYHRQCCAVLLSAVAVFSLSEFLFLIISLFHGAGSLSDPIQSVYQMWLIPYHISIAGWLVLVYLTRMVIVCGMTSVCVVLCHLPGNRWFKAFLLVLGVIVSWITYDSSSLWLVSLNPVHLIDVNMWMRSWVDLNVFSLPVSRYPVVIGISLCMIPPAFLSGRKETREMLRKASMPSHHCRMGVNLKSNRRIQYWLLQGGILSVIVVMTAVMVWNHNLRISISIPELYYQRYAEILDGTKSLEKDSFLEQEGMELMMQGSQDVYEKMLGYQKAMDQYAQMKENDVFHDTLLWEWISGREGIRTDLMGLMIVLAGLCIPVCFSYGLDSETGMERMHNSTGNTERIHHIQTRNIMVHAVILYLIVFCPVYVRAISIYGIQGLHAGIGLPCWVWMLVQTAVNILAITGFVSVCRRLAEKVKVSVYTVLACGSMIVLGALIVVMI